MATRKVSLVTNWKLLLSPKHLSAGYEVKGFLSLGQSNVGLLRWCDVIEKIHHYNQFFQIVLIWLTIQLLHDLEGANVGVESPD